MVCKHMYWLLICFLLTTVMHLDAFIYRIDILRRFNQKDKRYHYVFALGDWHDGIKIENASIEHRKNIEILIGSLKTKQHEVAFIVEDASSNCSVSANPCMQGVLGGLERCCAGQGILTENPEYRFKRMRACRPWLYHLVSKGMGHAVDPKDLRVPAKITVGDILDEHQLLVDSLFAKKQYIGDPLVNHYMSIINERIATLNLVDKKRISLNDYLSHTLSSGKTKSLMAMLTELLTFDSELIDLNILKSITAHLDKRYLFIIAGGAHTHHVVALLPRYGYEPVYSLIGKERNEYDLKKCVGGCVIDGTHCRQPEAISLESIKKYLALDGVR